MRVKTDSDDYYVDAEGVKIPVSTKYAANVMVVNGAVTDELIKEKLIPLVLYIDKTEFWKAQVEQIYVKERRMIMSSVATISSIWLSRRLKLKFGFKRSVFNRLNLSGWDQLNCECKVLNQVVCTKRLMYDRSEQIFAAVISVQQSNSNCGHGMMKGNRNYGFGHASRRVLNGESFLHRRDTCRHRGGSQEGRRIVCGIIDEVMSTLRTTP
jgi:hypothetical protein